MSKKDIKYNNVKLESEFTRLGNSLLKGNKLSEIKLKGKTYKFDYSREEFIETALKNGWKREGLVILGKRVTLEELADQYIQSKVKYINGKGEEDSISIQGSFISDFTSGFCLNSGGFGTGKSLALYIKMILLCKCFPGNRVLMGRKTLSDIDRAVLPELFDLMPANWFEYRVKDGLINFTNGSQIILFGLDAMQSGSIADIKKAQQKLKSLNLGAYFIDQLEEVEREVYEVLNSRLRRTNVPFRQGNMDCNPANFWAYHDFKLKESWNGETWIPNPNSKSTLLESSMLHNPNLPGDYVENQVAMGEEYVRRFVLGNWDTSTLMKGSVFAKEHIAYLERMRKPPLTVEEECQIFENYKNGEVYRMGVDPSEGVVDPSSITVMDSHGRKVARYNGMITIQGLADKVKYLYYKYGKPLIIPESNNAGTALIREIRDLRVYKNKKTDERWDRETEKLGFRTSWESKSKLISHFQNLLRAKALKIYDETTIEEMKTFLWNNDATQKGAGASRGFHDDEIMSTMLACWDWTPQKTEDIFAFKAMKDTYKRRFQYR